MTYYTSDETTVDEDSGLDLLTKYYVDPSVYDRTGRSFAFAVRSKMCAESRAKIGEMVETRVPVKDGKSKRVKFNTQEMRYGDDPIAVIQECCSLTASYRNTELPLKEILFRILLADGNEPKSIMELYQEAQDWVGRSDGRLINPRVIHSILDEDAHYGFAVAAD